MKKKAQAKTRNEETLRDLERAIGKRIRENRVRFGWTQKNLADALKLSYQQVQKYETGINRVSAGRLYQIAGLIGTDIGDFFEDLETVGTREGEAAKSQILETPGNLLTDDVQKALNSLVKALAKNVH